VKYEFVRAHRDQFKVSRLCAVFEISRSGYYGWRGRKESTRVKANRMVLSEIHKVHEQSKQADGAIKTWRELKAKGISCGRHRVVICAEKRGSKPDTSADFALRRSRA
jgi:putative transposase